jgi:hypothetical protein
MTKNRSKELNTITTIAENSGYRRKDYNTMRKWIHTIGIQTNNNKSEPP